MSDLLWNHKSDSADHHKSHWLLRLCIVHFMLALSFNIWFATKQGPINKIKKTVNSLLMEIHFNATFSSHSKCLWKHHLIKCLHTGLNIHSHWTVNTFELPWLLFYHQNQNMHFFRTFPHSHVLTRLSQVAWLRVVFIVLLCILWCTLFLLKHCFLRGLQRNFTI